MKKRELKTLKLNKKSIANLKKLQGGVPGKTWRCGNDTSAPSDDDHDWFTDANEWACETFDGTGCF